MTTKISLTSPQINQDLPPRSSKCRSIFRIVNVVGGALLGLAVIYSSPPDSCQNLGERFCKQLGTNDLSLDVQRAIYKETPVPTCYLGVPNLDNSILRDQFSFSENALNMRGVKGSTAQCFPELIKEKSLDVISRDPAKLTEPCSLSLSEKVKKFVYGIFD